MQNLLEVKGLEKEFSLGNGFFKKSSKTFKAVNGIDLTIKKGEIIGLIGESGSGKSTIGRMVLRLIEPSSGKIIYDGKDLTNLSHKEMKEYYRKMQIIFQDSASSFNPRKTIGEQIVNPMLRLGVANTKKEAEEEVLRLLVKVGLKEEHFIRYPHEFSGGQRQRIGIARALALKPEFLVLDEPTSALDVSIQAQILNLLLDLQEEFNLTYLFIGHNLSIIKFFCDRVAVLYKGRLVELADSDTLYKTPYHPVSRMLLDSVLSLDKKPLLDNVNENTGKGGGCVFSEKCGYAIDVCYGAHPEVVHLDGGHQYACYNPPIEEGVEFQDEPQRKLS
ncbi:ABC transporter ATP-binding protein [Alkalihalobacillus oceani]|uniref:ABC transporter ATP-binding protein n=1 Tax=Halalkalibacter oceani TaxID=1653776 RepID=UPI00203C109B|nr:ABC transporter ATP-binding protein [Halalkalibacter oceani]MCM3763156.1 ABC transporter ATP-binding protein [Halalkalibacter oceani]